MPILNNPFNVTFSRTQVPSAGKKEAMYTLTNLGREQLESMQGNEPEFDIISTMGTRRAWNVEDLSQAVKAPVKGVQHSIDRLVKQHFVKTVGADGG